MGCNCTKLSPKPPKANFFKRIWTFFAILLLPKPKPTLNRGIRLSKFPDALETNANKGQATSNRVEK